MTYRYQCKFTIKIIAVLSVFFLLTGCGANRAVSRGKTGNKVEDTVQGQIQKEKDSSRLFLSCLPLSVDISLQSFLV